jgi:pimeloyl-ACP methyl ester carboxylesterase
MTITMRSVKIGNRRLRLLEQPGTGPTIVLVHGIPGSARCWERVIGQLTDAHVIAPDLLGFGESSRSGDKVELHAENQARLLAAVLDEIEVNNAVFVGHDFGGPIALELTRHRPDLVSGLVLAATNSFGDTPIPMPLRLILLPWIGPILERLLLSRTSQRMMLRQGVGPNAPRLDPATYLGDRSQSRATRLIFGHSLRNLATLYEPLAATLGSVHVPTLVIWGDSDPFFDVETGRRTAGAIGGARFELLADAGHFLPAERPVEFAALVASLAAETAVA